MKHTFFFLIFFLSSISLFHGSDFESSVDKLLARTVPLISTTQLASEIESGTKIILLDTRHQKEFAVSHLPSARRVGFFDFKETRVEDIDKDSPIVVYCSVGYRSEKIGERLQASGFTNVRNLYGGIFAWANKANPLHGPDGDTTETVHGFDANWSKLLDPEVPVVTE